MSLFGTNTAFGASSGTAAGMFGGTAANTNTNPMRDFEVLRSGYYVSRIVRKLVFGFPTRSDTNQAYSPKSTGNTQEAVAVPT